MKPLKVLMKSALAAVVIATGVVSVSGSFLATSVTEAQAAVVRSIQVKGNVRMDADTVASYLTIKPGQSFSGDDIDESVKALYGTGLFSDVSIRQSGSVLVVDVVENATISKVYFEGNNRLKDAALSAGVQTKPLTTYSEDTVLSDVEEIKRAYQRVGRDDTQVGYEVVPLANNRVNVIFRINESGKTPVGRIIFVGNERISDYRLRDIISTKQTNFLSFLRTDDIYDPDRLKADEERLRQFYYNQGYADFQLVSANAQLDSETNRYTITFTVEEGPRYTFGNVSIQSSINGVDPTPLYSEVKSISGDYYSARDVEKSVVAITEKVAEAGYAFAEVTPRGNRNFENNTIDITYYVDEGARIYIEAINIVGNDKTREYVIRREFDISEGDAFNQVLIDKAKRRLESTGLFERVVITNRPGDAPDRIVVVVHIVEKATGEFSAGGGYSSQDGALATISFSEKNFLGRGQYLRLSAGFGRDTDNYGISFTEPYFLGYRISAGFDFNHESSDRTDSQSYKSTSDSGKLRFGIPITENLNSTVYYVYRDEDTDIGSSAFDKQYKKGEQDIAKCAAAVATKSRDDGCQGNNRNEISAAFADSDGSFIHSGFGMGLTYADFDNYRDPREGIYASGAVEWFGAGGDATYGKTQGSLIGYTLLNEDYDIVGMARARGGYIFNTGDDNDGFRDIDNFFGSGGHVRGWDNRGFGARDPFTKDALGGRHYFNATAEVQFPMPLLPKSAGFRGALFADAGMVGGLRDRAKDAILDANPDYTNSDYDQITDDNWRYSVGASVIWDSPFGPLRVDYAFPLNDKKYDELREFSLGVSTKF